MGKTNKVKHKAFFESLKKVPLEIINQEYELIKEKKSYLTASQREIVVGFAQYIQKNNIKTKQDEQLHNEGQNPND